MLKGIHRFLFLQNRRIVKGDFHAGVEDNLQLFL